MWACHNVCVCVCGRVIMCVCVCVCVCRATEESILVTYRDSQSAMAATALSGERVNQSLSVSI